MEELFKSSAGTSSIFTAVGVDPSALFSAKEAGIAVITYAKNEGLERRASSSTHVMLDTQLCDALFKVSRSWLDLGFRAHFTREHVMTQNQNELALYRLGGSSASCPCNTLGRSCQ